MFGSNLWISDDCGCRMRYVYANINSSRSLLVYRAIMTIPFWRSFARITIFASFAANIDIHLSDTFFIAVPFSTGLVKIDLDVVNGSLKEIFVRTCKIRMHVQ
jgi:hypothetical protein